MENSTDLKEEKHAYQDWVCSVNEKPDSKVTWDLHNECLIISSNKDKY